MGSGGSKAASTWSQQTDRAGGASSSRRAAAAAVGRTVLGEVLTTLIAVGGLVWALKLTLSYMDPYREQRQESRRQAAVLKARLGRNIELNEYEMLLASNILNPRTIDVALDDIGGLEEVKEEMRLKVLKPLGDPVTFCTTLWRPAKGVLFYGPPGTGKTMLAKALARESNCFFLNVTASAVMSKWFGDANRFIRAIFTLAAKLQPCVIFIDEVDAFLTKRGTNSEHEATLQAKTEFMQLWDGMESASGMRVLVMGATNRPWMVDDAVLRRFTLQYEVGLPTAAERAAIIRRYLLRHEAEMRALAAAGKLGAEEGRVDMSLLINKPVARGRQGALDIISERTAGYSGSDLMEVCAQAAQNVLAQKWVNPDQPLRQLLLSDLEAALAHVKPSTTRADEYGTSDHARRYSGAGASSSGSPLPGAGNWSLPESLVWELLSGGGDVGASGPGVNKGKGAALAALAAAAAAAAAANVQQGRPRAGSNSSSPDKVGSRRANGVEATSSTAAGAGQNGAGDAADSSSNEEYEEAHEGEAVGAPRQLVARNTDADAAAVLAQLILQQQAAGMQ